MLALALALAAAPSASQTFPAIGLRPTPQAAQTRVADGFTLAASTPIPLYSVFAPLAAGTRLEFDGVHVRTVPSAVGAPPLLQLSAFVFPSFLLVDPSSSFAIAGESSSMNLWRIDLVNGGATVLANVSFNFDAALEGSSSLIVSAATCGFGCGNDLVRVDLASGATTTIGNVNGASGPLCFVAGGDLVYAQQSHLFPAPAGAVTLLRWSAATLASGAFLTEANATVLASGLDGASDLAFDARSGLLFVSASTYATTLDAESAILAFDLAGNLVATVARGNRSLGQLAVRATGGDGWCAPFEPQGVELWATSTDFVTSEPSELMRIRPARASAATSGPGLEGAGVVRCEIAGAPPLGRAWLFAAPIALYDAAEPRTSFLGGSLPLAAPAASWLRVAPSATTDAFGRATFEWTAPHGAHGTHVLQAVFADHQGRIVGTSAPAFD